MTARYAIYYAPPPESPLSQRAAAWLGRDAFSGRRLRRPALPQLSGLNLDTLTRDARGYGFHATLKAPFELAEGVTETQLLDAAAAFAAQRAPFEAAIEPAVVGGRFLAFVLAAPSAEMDALHRDCVTAFDRFRAPLSDFDLERRRKSALSPEQDARLLAWGYPYVFEDFRFHMTLTGSVRDPRVAQCLLESLKDHFAPDTGLHDFGGVAVFKQPTRKATFRVLSRVEFAPQQARRSAVA